MNKILTLIITSIFLIGIASALVIESVDVSPGTVEPGKSFSINVDLENNENIDLENIEVSLDLTNLPIIQESSSEITLDIDEDDKESADFDLQVLDNAQSGVYTIPITINYVDEDNKTTIKKTTAAIRVNALPIIEVSREDGLLIKGQESTLTLKIINKGLGDAKFSEVSITPVNMILNSQAKIYIGDIDSNDFANEDFKIIINSNAPNTISLPVNIVYKDALNKEYSQDSTLSLRVYSLDEAYSLGLLQKNNTSLYIGAAIAIIILFFIYRAIRKRMRKRKLERGE